MGYSPAKGLSKGKGKGKSAKGKGKGAHEVDTSNPIWDSSDDCEYHEDDDNDHDNEPMGGGDIEEISSWTQVVKGPRIKSCPHANLNSKGKCHNPFAALQNHPCPQANQPVSI